ncbi:MAG: glycosyltransferase family 2 protein [Planctomycetota bacterium]|jgi:glycosyltransferase involved in cell wall biosynthesis
MNDQTKPFVSVIIPVYNDLDRLKTCLEALEEQTYPGNLYEIIVVNNNPAHNIEPDIVNFNNVHLFCESHRSSYAARNKGIMNARGAVIAFTDSDCIPKTDWIEKGVTNLLNEHNCGLVAGRIDVFCSDPESPTAIELYEKITAFKQKTYVKRLRFGATANLFTFKKIIQKVGCFNYALLSSGDFEWGNRVFAAGYKQVYADDTCVSHPALKTFGQRFRKRIRIIRGKNKSGTLSFSLRIFMKRLFIPLREAKKVVFEGKYDEFLRGKKQKLKFSAVYFFDSYVWTFGSLVINLLGRKKH